MSPALIQLAKFYDLPSNLRGLSTKSNHIDAQYGYESVAGTILSYLSGADEIYSIGLLGSAQILSLEKMVMDNQLIHQVEAMLTPINVDDAHLQADLIKRVGVGGEYLTQRETLRYTRKEYMPLWPPHGSDLTELIHTEALEILQNHKAPNLPEGVKEKIASILADADKALTI
jgi:trimethylamine--corrinoid protein Co-methyltransferase